MSGRKFRTPARQRGWPLCQGPSQQSFPPPPPAGAGGVTKNNAVVKKSAALRIPVGVDGRRGIGPKEFRWIRMAK